MLSPIGLPPQIAVAMLEPAVFVFGALCLLCFSIIVACIQSVVGMLSEWMLMWVMWLKILYAIIFG